MKQINRREWEISSSAAIVEYVIKNGFKNIVALEKGADGKPYILLDNKIYALTETYEGEKLPLSTPDNIIEFTGVLGSFHNAAEGFTQPSGIKIKAYWGKSIERYRTMTSNLEKYNKIVNIKGPNNSFEEYTMVHLDTLLKRAKASLKTFRSLGYLNTLEKSMIKKEICLNKISNNIGVTSKKGIIITNVFDLGYNMVEEDLGNLIKIGLANSGDPLLYKEVITEYSKARYLEDSSVSIIKAIITFPYDTIKVINRYMNKRQEVGILLGKYKKYFDREYKCDIWGG